MNFLFVYCTAFLIFCVICIVNDFRDKSHNKEEKVDTLAVTKGKFLLNFTVFAALTFLLPSIIFCLLKKILATFNFVEADLELLSMLVSQSITLMYIVFLRKYLRLKNIYYKIGQVLKQGLSAFGRIFLLILLVSCLWLSFLLVLKKCGLPLTLNEQSVVTLFSDIDNFWFKIIFAVLATFIAPFIEEHFFRAGVYRIFKGKLTPKSAAIWTSIIFAVLHFNLVSLIPLFVLSLYLVKSYEQSGNIYVPIVIHGAFNFNSVVLMLLSAG